jgi:hypothetical protein
VGLSVTVCLISATMGAFCSDCLEQAEKITSVDRRREKAEKRMFAINPL